MQLNMFLAKSDEASLLGFIRARGGYVARDDEEKGETRVETGATLDAKPNTTLHILAKQAFPPSQLSRREWRRRVRRGLWRSTSQIVGPSIGYQIMKDGVAEGVVHSRLWNDVTSVSFYGPLPRKGGLPAGFPHGHEDKEGIMRKLYQAVGRDVRKAFSRFGSSPGAIWVGPGAVAPAAAAGWKVSL